MKKYNYKYNSTSCRRFDNVNTNLWMFVYFAKLISGLQKTLKIRNLLKFWVIGIPIITISEVKLGYFFNPHQNANWIYGWKYYIQNINYYHSKN